MGLALAIIVGHHAFDHINPDSIRAPIGLEITGNGCLNLSLAELIVAYPLFPWLGVFVGGNGIGKELFVFAPG